MCFFIVVQCQELTCHKKIVGQFTMKFSLMNLAF